VGFFDGTQRLGAAALVGNVATFSTSHLTLGSNPISAYYVGDLNFQFSISSFLNEQINKPVATATTIVASANRAGLGQPVTFSAAVNSKSGALTGIVVFKDGNSTLGTGKRTGDGTFTFTTSTLSVGAHAITASYSGDSFHATSASTQLAETIEQIATVSLASSLNPSTSGKLVTFTATVSGSAGLATGSVTFKEGTKTLGTAKLVNGRAVFQTSNLAAGDDDRITASYSGDNTYLAAASPTITQSVNPKPSSASSAAVSSTTAGTSLGTTSANGNAIDTALRALFLDDSTVAGKPRPLFEL
jgi:hypothetical protein